MNAIEREEEKFVLCYNVPTAYGNVRTKMYVGNIHQIDDAIKTAIICGYEIISIKRWDDAGRPVTIEKEIL